ncbi:MRF1 [Candida pseudojiufengensis]|uniref:MRF1 n=1 Tax=Candida pseudojiufengensis TaxID=497109 RepID=UPI0022245637|nr:MRF1 [Candida pseudojiufengensis]KAI5965602.1 MRF1 [Candida pseudojiufengensis]
MIRHIRCILPRTQRFYSINSKSTIPNIDLPKLHPLLIQRAKFLTNEHEEISKKLDTYDPDLQIKFDRLTNIIDTFTKFKTLNNEILELKQIKDPELISEAQDEINNLLPQLQKLITELQTKLLPPLKYSESKTIIELRPGIGGSEASLFTEDLLQMYINFAIFNKWKYKIISQGKNANGFMNEAILSIDEIGSYDILRHESGVHRVQRIPETESKGRIHTSTSAVVILPKISEGNETSLKNDEMQFKPGEIRIDTMRASGKGGQHVNTTDSAVRLVHIPTGIIVVQQDERSQPQNKAKAFAILRSRLAELERIEEIEKQKNLRISQVSSTDRSDKIRTYNYPQNRITDHRCGYSLHDLQGCLKGEKLKEIIDKVKEVEYKERMEEMVSNGVSDEK